MFWDWLKSFVYPFKKKHSKIWKSVCLILKRNLQRPLKSQGVIVPMVPAVPSGNTLDYFFWQDLSMHLTLKRVGWQPTVKEHCVSVEKKKRKLIWNLKEASWKRKHIYNYKQPMFLRFHVRFQGGNTSSIQTVHFPARQCQLARVKIKRVQWLGDMCSPRWLSPDVPLVFP